MSKINKSFDSTEDLYPENTQFTNIDFNQDVDYFNDKNNLINISSRGSTEGASTGNNRIANYLCPGGVPSEDIINSNNFKPKSLCLTEESQKDEIIIPKNEKTPAQTSKTVEEKKIEKNFVVEDKFFDSANLLILEKTVGNKVYGVYQNLENYDFSMLRYTLKNAKNPAYYVGNVIRKNNPYLNNDDYYYINKYNYYWDYLASIGPFGFIRSSAYANINFISFG